MKSSKISFQPKDARTVSTSYEDEDDDDMSDFYPHGKRTITGTQALVDFLKTTSPEEFQRSAPERSVNSLFSKIRKTKRNTPSITPTPSISSHSVPSNGSVLTSPTSYHGSEFIPRKNYIEIAPPKLISKSAGNSRSPSFDTTSIQSFVLRNTNNNNKGEPILPNKKRESSVYSGSLRHSGSIRSQVSTNRSPLTREVRKVDARVTEEFLHQRDGMDTIESALLQRLERMKMMNETMPSDKVAAGLATEHIRALGITHDLDSPHETYKTSHVRHMQVQTEDWSETYAPEPPNTDYSYDEEGTDIRTRRAEAALQNALDHFEVISGLAYKKLRELWEEKMRWENACMELRDRLIMMEQKRYQHDQGGLENLRNDYFPKHVEEEDGLGLSEFPCSEN